MPLAEAEHFVRAPGWTWYILFYFFFAGLAGGCYLLATLLRLRGSPADEPAARLGYYVTLPTIALCGLLLSLDLGRPLRFWHMLVNTSPGGGANFKAWSPMSVGSWALLVFGIFAVVPFLEALVRDGMVRLPLSAPMLRLLEGPLGQAWTIVGSVVALFIAGYTGVLLAVSNQPVWSDSWALGGLFLASGLSGSAALLMLLTHYRPAARGSLGALELSERLFAALELLLIVVFLLTLIPAGTVGRAFGFPWILLWLVALAGLLPGIGNLALARLAPTGERALVVPALGGVAVPALVLLGVLALRAAVIFGAQ